MKMKLIQILVILSVCSNRFMSNVSGDPERAVSGPVPIDLNLLKINTSYYNILKSENEPEGYKLILKEGYIIKSITNNVDPIWNQSGDTFCKGFTIYNINDKTIILIVNIENKDKKDYLYLMKEGNALGYLGLFNLLNELNREAFQTQKIKKQNIMISDPFEKLYFKHSKTIIGNYIHEEFEPNENEKFNSVRDRSEYIWTAKEVNNVEILANKVEVYKENVVESYREDFIFKYRRVPKYRIVIITLDNEEKLHYKLDKVEDEWIEIGEEEFIYYCKKEGLDKKKVKNEEVTKGNGTRRGIEIVDISKKSDKFNYYKYNLLEYKMVSLVKKQFKKVDKIYYENEMITEVGKCYFLINLVKYSEYWHYIEFISTSYAYIYPTKYYTHYISSKEWKHKENKDFVDMIYEQIKRCEEESCPKYVGIFGIENGLPIKNLPKNIKEKIGDESIDEEDNIYEEIEEYQEENKKQKEVKEEDDEGVNEDEEEENIYVDMDRKNKDEDEDEEVYVDMDMKNRDDDEDEHRYQRVSGYWSFEDKDKDEDEIKDKKGKNKEELKESESESKGKLESEIEKEMDDIIVKKFIRKVKRISKKLKEKVFNSGYKEKGIILWIGVMMVLWTEL